MKYNIENKKVSDVLGELGEEYKDLLVEKVLSQHQEYDLDYISLSDLIKLDEKTKESLLANERINRRNRLTSVFSIVGLIYTLCGSMFLFYYLFWKSYEFDEITGVLALWIFGGLVVSLLSILMKGVPRPLHYTSKDTSKYFNYRIVNAWKQIEGLLVQVTPTEENVSLSGMMSYLTELTLLSQSDVSTIKKILTLRNQIVHSNSIEKKYTTSEIQTLLRDANNIIKKLEKFENE